MKIRSAVISVDIGWLPAMKMIAPNSPSKRANDKDTPASSAGVSVNLATGTGSGGDAQGDVLTGIEMVIGSALADRLTGSTGADVLLGGGGNDVLIGGLGDDTLGVLRVVLHELTEHIHQRLDVLLG